jgi:hypothetical protein
MNTQINASVTSSTVNGQSDGAYSINSQNGYDTLSGSHMMFIVSTHDAMRFTPGSSHNFIDMRAGGSVVLNGDHNTVTGGGAIEAVDSSPASNHNTFTLGLGVTSFAGGNIQPSDVFKMVGFTKADIARAFATRHQVSPQSEFLTFTHPGGATLHMGFTAEYPWALPMQGQFHPFHG